MTWFLIGWLYFWGMLATAWGVTETRGSVSGWSMLLVVLLWPLTLPATLVFGAINGDLRTSWEHREHERVSGDG